MSTPLEAGATLGRYELLLPIAQGGMAQVWAARLPGTRGFSKTVAVKTMLPMLSADARFEKMFLSEAEIAARIKHPNVCEILDLGEEDGVLYLVMEWIDGEPLVTLAADCEEKGRQIPHEVAARLVLDAARGLHAAHELRDDDGALFGVVHRDVSPHNILVTSDGIVKIVDFGVAKAAARADYQQTSTGHIKGKVQYMSPEQAFCDEIDRRADIFALGIVLYHLTTGVHPFRADNELATLARITSPNPVPAAEKIAPGYPPVLARVVARALAKDKDERYATMADLARDLEGVLTALAADGHDVSAESFVGEVLADRAADRASALKAAARLADERTGKGSGAGIALRAPDAAAVTGAPVTMQAERGSGRSVAILAAAAGLAVGLGLAGLVLSGRGKGESTAGAPAIRVQVPEPTAFRPPTPESAAAALTPREAAPAGPSAAAPSATAAPSASASASAAPPRKPAAPRLHPAPKPTAAQKPPSSTLRSPGF